MSVKLYRRDKKRIYINQVLGVEIDCSTILLYYLDTPDKSALNVALIRAKKNCLKEFMPVTNVVIKLREIMLVVE